MREERKGACEAEAEAGGGGPAGVAREPGACRKGRSARGRRAVRAPTLKGATVEWEGKPLLQGGV